MAPLSALIGAIGNQDLFVVLSCCPLVIVTVGKLPANKKQKQNSKFRFRLAADKQRGALTTTKNPPNSKSKQGGRFEVVMSLQKQYPCFRVREFSTSNLACEEPKSTVAGWLATSS